MLTARICPDLFAQLNQLVTKEKSRSGCVNAAILRYVAVRGAN